MLQTATSSRQSVFVSLTSSDKSVAWLECVCMPFITFNLIGCLFYPWGEKQPGNYCSPGSNPLKSVSSAFTGMYPSPEVVTSRRVKSKYIKVKK